MRLAVKYDHDIEEHLHEHTKAVEYDEADVEEMKLVRAYDGAHLLFRVHLLRQSHVRADHFAHGREYLLVRVLGLIAWQRVEKQAHRLTRYDRLSRQIQLVLTFELKITKI